jgi:hypothetical protein
MRGGTRDERRSPLSRRPTRGILATGRNEWTTGDLKPGRDFIIALAIAAAVDATIFSAPGVEFPSCTILNTGIALGTVAVSLLFLDLGRRIGARCCARWPPSLRWPACSKIMHVLAALGGLDLGAVQQFAPAPALGRGGRPPIYCRSASACAVFIPSTSRLSITSSRWVPWRRRRDCSC